MSAFDEAFDYLRQNQPQGRFMGGSTGARGHDLPMGRFVEKRGAHPDHIQNEFDMNQYLNALGVAVPQAGLQGDTMLTAMEAGQPVGYNPTQQDIRQLTTDFVPHALVANWDVLGMEGDNAIRRPDGTLSYVDVGGAGKYRAMGAPKGGAFATSVGELDTLREKNPALAGITEQDIGRSYDTHGGQTAMEDALRFLRDNQTRNTMQQRVQDLARRVA